MSHARSDRSRPQRSSPRSTRRAGPLAAVREAAIVVVAALVLSFLVKTFLAQPFVIPSESMQATLEPGDRVVASLLTPGSFDLHRGDVVVFDDPGDWLPPAVPVARSPVKGAVVDTLQFLGVLPRDAGNHLIKRIIGLPGDHVRCCDAGGRLQVNGVSIDEEAYLYPGDAPSQAPGGGAFDVTVPAGSMWVMGDHRSDSADSRFHQNRPGGGTVPLSDVVGKAEVIAWPIPRWSLLSGHHDVFADVPAAGEKTPSPK